LAENQEKKVKRYEVRRKGDWLRNGNFRAEETRENFDERVAYIINSLTTSENLISVQYINTQTIMFWYWAD